LQKKMRVAGVVVGLAAALTPAALLASQVNTPATGSAVVAQATATAAPKATGTPAAPKTGNAGFANEAGTAGVAATLAVLAVGVVAGGRVLAARRS